MIAWLFSHDAHDDPGVALARTIAETRVIPVPKWWQPSAASGDGGAVLWIDQVRGHLVADNFAAVPVQGWLRITAQGAYLDVGRGGHARLFDPFSSDISVPAPGVLSGWYVEGGIHMRTTLTVLSGDDAADWAQAICAVLADSCRPVALSRPLERPPLPPRFQEFDTPADLAAWASVPPVREIDDALEVALRWLADDSVPCLRDHAFANWYAQLIGAAEHDRLGRHIVRGECLVSYDGLAFSTEEYPYRFTVPWTEIRRCRVVWAGQQPTLHLLIGRSSAAVRVRVRAATSSWLDDVRLLAALIWRHVPALRPVDLAYPCADRAPLGMIIRDREACRR